MKDFFLEGDNKTAAFDEHGKLTENTLVRKQFLSFFLPIYSCIQSAVNVTSTLYELVPVETAPGQTERYCLKFRNGSKKSGVSQYFTLATLIDVDFTKGKIKLLSGQKVVGPPCTHKVHTNIKVSSLCCCPQMAVFTAVKETV